MKLLTFIFGFLLCILIAEGNFLDKLKGVGEKIGNVGEKFGKGFANVGKKIGLEVFKLGKPLVNPLCKVINVDFTYLIKLFSEIMLPRHFPYMGGSRGGWEQGVRTPPPPGIARLLIFAMLKFSVRPLLGIWTP